MGLPVWLKRLWPWRLYGEARGWPEIPPPTVPPTAPPEFRDAERLELGQDLCVDCGHETTAHPWPGRQDLVRCAACTAEEFDDERDLRDVCARRYSRPL